MVGHGWHATTTIAGCTGQRRKEQGGTPDNQRKQRPANREESTTPGSPMTSALGTTAGLTSRQRSMRSIIQGRTECERPYPLNCRPSTRERKLLAGERGKKTMADVGSLQWQVKKLLEECDKNLQMIANQMCTIQVANMTLEEVRRQNSSLRH